MSQLDLFKSLVNAEFLDLADQWEINQTAMEYHARIVIGGIPWEFTWPADCPDRLIEPHTRKIAALAVAWIRKRRLIAEK